MKYEVYAITKGNRLVPLGSTWSRDFAFTLYREHRDSNNYKEVYIDEPNFLVGFVLDILGV